jgi:hypothetical protein
MVQAALRRSERMKNHPWVRIASSVLLAIGLLKRNGLLAESTLEAMRTQVFS